MSQSINGRGPIESFARTADYALKTEQSGTCHTNDGAAGAVTITLPSATPGLHYQFSVEAAQALRVAPQAADTVSLPSTGAPGAAGKGLTCSSVGSTVELFCTKPGSWRVRGSTGNWAAIP